MMKLIQVHYYKREKKERERKEEKHACRKEEIKGALVAGDQGSKLENSQKVDTIKGRTKRKWGKRGKWQMKKRPSEIMSLCLSLFKC